MREIKKMVVDQLGKMWTDKSLIFGAVSGGLSIAIPQWIFESRWGVSHTVLILILVGVLLAEQLVGRRLAKLSPVTAKSSEVMIDSLVRDVIMLMICAAAYGLDFLFNSGSVIFVIVVASFIYHNFYSLMANAVVLGWGKNFPMWLFFWLNDEIILKAKKYFPNSSIKNELDKKMNRVDHSDLDEEFTPPGGDK